MLALYCVTSSAWHGLHSCGLLTAFETFPMPWQVMQVEESLGLPSAAWALALSAFAASAWHVTHEADAVFALWLSAAAPAWQSRQCRLPCAPFMCVEALTLMSFPWEFFSPTAGLWQVRQSDASCGRADGVKKTADRTSRTTEPIRRLRTIPPIRLLPKLRDAAGSPAAWVPMTCLLPCSFGTWLVSRRNRRLAAPASPESRLTSQHRRSGAEISSAATHARPLQRIPCRLRPYFCSVRINATTS